VAVSAALPLEVTRFASRSRL